MLFWLALNVQSAFQVDLTCGARLFKSLLYWCFALAVIAPYTTLETCFIPLRVEEGSCTSNRINALQLP
jgi:hypothetical protein